MIQLKQNVDILPQWQNVQPCLVLPDVEKKFN